MKHVTVDDGDVRNRLSMSTIAQSSGQSRWQTEAMRSHSAPRLFYFTRGQGRITIAGLTSGYGANNLVFLPAGTMHGFEVGPTVFGQCLTIPAAMAGEWPDAPVHLRLRDVVAQKDVAKLFDHLERELGSTAPGHARAAHYVLGLLSVFFERQMEARPAEPADARNESSAARLVAAFSDLVERDYRKGLGVADFARSLGVTATHLTRCCRRTCGRSALALLNDRRTYEARVLLRETKRPVGEIATVLGFSSAAYFSRTFHARTGQTPSDFRRAFPPDAALRRR